MLDGRVFRLSLSILVVLLAIGAAATPPALAQQTNAAAASAAADHVNSAPEVRIAAPQVIAPGISILPDNHVNYVPNIGLIEGSRAILVVDTGLGPRNGQRVFDFARKIAKDRQIYLTTTHFHPEHNFGASAFKGSARIVINQAQAEELREKGASYIALFRQFGPDVDAALEGTILVPPDETYVGQMTLDLGGRKVELREMPAHTRGDQIVYVPDAGVVFGGDLVEEGFFPILPDPDSRGHKWIEVLESIAALQPRIVVPGHGLVGDVRRVTVIRDYLQTVERRVGGLARQGVSQAEVTQRLTPGLKELHPDWNNAVFIAYEIAIFYAEVTGQPPQLPSLEADLERPTH